MKILAIAVGVVGVAIQTAIAAPNSPSNVQVQCYSIQNNNHFNALRPRHITEVARDFCNKYRGENLGTAGGNGNMVTFETLDGDPRNAFIIFQKMPTQPEGLPVKWDVDICIDLFNRTIECPKIDPGNSELARWGGGEALIFDPDTELKSWAASITP
ncbi:hypothetical protein AJ79_04865 [Helicocarpus griseus UAMH5409]|uniref:Ecp2 effector protein domain-containing protein n=1 Tax=Helicocarpus griseus UAMH5409 TaxID=1447875 RepID=A0A2B7XR89_9EURO|nr:hypothetical protein AJ79_04865 [Helicocarpus griseus UAMH5409]